MSDTIFVKEIKLNDIKQTEIDDAGRNALCMALCKIQMAGAMVGKVYDLAEVNKIVDRCIEIGALRSTDKKNSDGWVANHEKIAEACGLKNVKNVYKKFDRYDIVNRIQWGQPIELRDEGKHSLLAVGWYKEGDDFFLTVIDPWPKTDDKRLDLSRAMTQRKVGGKWVDSRSIEYYGYFEKIEKNGVK